MKKRTLLSMAMVATMTVATFAGCGGSREGTTEEAATTETEATTERVRLKISPRNLEIAKENFIQDWHNKGQKR